VPSGLIDEGEEFHVLLKIQKRDITFACYELENRPAPEPERLEIDLNNFP
jgi:hypothetical protein